MLCISVFVEEEALDGFESVAPEERELSGYCFVVEFEAFLIGTVFMPFSWASFKDVVGPDMSATVMFRLWSFFNLKFFSMAFFF